MATNFMINLPRKATNVILNHVQRRHMPVNVPPTATGKRRFRLAVETDPHKLVNYCCGLNYHIDEPPIQLKSDEEYPDWLWNLRLGPKPNSWEMEKGTKEYYLRLAEEGVDRNYLLKLRSAKPTKIVGKVLKSDREYLNRLRFAALAHMEDDQGLENDAMEHEWMLTSMASKITARDYYMAKKDDKVLYYDKIEGNTHKKNYLVDEESSFKPLPRRVQPRSPIVLPAIQDSKRRHRYTGT